MRDHVLLLNANYEPINVCSLRRAVGLMLKMKATLVLNGRGFIKGINCEYPKPSIIRLSYMVHRPRPHLKLTRDEVFRRDNYTCQYCGNPGRQLTLDHVVPRHMGGEKSWENVVTACPTCNHRKGGRTLDDASMRLLHQPYEPPSSAYYLNQKYLSDYHEWEPFLTGW